MRLMILWVFAIQILLISLFIPIMVDAEERPSKMEKRFELFILKEDWIELGSTYDPQEMQERLKQTDYRKSNIMVITEEEIETYDWSEQSIILTPRASHQLKDDLKKKLGKRGFLNQLAFTLSFDNEPYLRGLFLYLASAVFIRIPIIYFDRSKERFTFYIRPITMYFFNYKEIPLDMKKVIEKEVIKNHFNELGKLR